METNNNISCLRQLLDEDTSRFISAEVQLKNNLNKWIVKETSVAFKIILHEYIDLMGQHIRMLESFCEAERINSLSLSNRVMKAYIDETNEKLSVCTCPEVKDACLLAAIQGINHFKISAYGTAAAFANTLELGKAAALFHKAELNEKSIDERLSFLAENDINPKAKSAILLPG
ncbi:hypothetical protein BH09BAC6_BH09BAC6_15050 [soil metagenome]|jgi:ferritin-like metal-binding protein YciE